LLAASPSFQGGFGLEGKFGESEAYRYKEVTHGQPQYTCMVMMQINHTKITKLKILGYVDNGAQKNKCRRELLTNSCVSLPKQPGF
jgi:hypothetical protein